MATPRRSILREIRCPLSRTMTRPAGTRLPLAAMPCIPMDMGHFFKILPFLEQQPLYNLANFAIPAPRTRTAPANFAGQDSIALVAVPGYYCPSRRAPQIYNRTTSKNDYAGCAGFFQGEMYECQDSSNRWVPAPPNGLTPYKNERDAVNQGDTSGRKGAIAHGVRSKLPAFDFRDGTSNSILAAENVVAERPSWLRRGDNGLLVQCRLG